MSRIAPGANSPPKMRMATPQLRELARRLFAHEAARRGEPGGSAETMARACQRLYQRLNPLIGTGGLHALLIRALHLAGAEYPWLDAVKVEEHPGCSLKGLSEAAEGRGTAETSEGFSAMIANIIWLLVTFIGEDIILSLVYEAWPEIRTEAGIPGSDEGNEL